MWVRQKNVARDGNARGEGGSSLFPHAPRSFLRLYDFQAVATQVKCTRKRYMLEKKNARWNVENVLYRGSDNCNMPFFIPCNSVAYYTIFCESLPYQISLRICWIKISPRRQGFSELLRSSVNCISLLKILSLCVVLILLLLLGVTAGSILTRKVSLVVPLLISSINDLSKIGS